MIELGQEIEDRISGINGIATARLTTLYGEEKIEMTPTSLAVDGTPRAAIWFTEQQVEVLNEKKVKAGFTIPERLDKGEGLPP